ncbi:hypothetical protein [Nitrosovibrio sp. Nv6]|uniref:hypothetical protein n=1 Tax=Nitrosovibrio sp. Nv6 TaxID=1855340 RepID=UPI0008C42767|nr:hypothetical protein [Nitrosovibrio sp. Nv6]SEO63998.1 hypothetical protein SAMN05216316_0683 [Nitrosovibrio sp. Nv6]
MNEVTPFHWGEIALSETVFIDGAPHASRFAIGEWLEYEDPAEGIRKILNRNSYIEEHSVPVKLTATDGKKYDTKVYHPIGFLLIVMESGQPKAQAMKQAVAEFVWHFAGPRRMSFKERTELLKLSRVLLNDLAKTRDAFVQNGLVTHLREVHLALGQPLPDTAMLGKDAAQLPLKGV